MPHRFGAMAGRPWAKVVVAAAVCAAMVASASPAQAVPAGAAPVAGQSDATVLGTVTLITGDRVEVARTHDGPYLATLVPREDGTRSTARVVDSGEDVFVIPIDVEPYIAAGSLDRELFNVTGLLRAETAGEIPLILQYGGGAAARTMASRQAPAHSTRTAVLESIDAQAVEVRAGDAEEFWTGLKGSLAAGSATRGLAGGVEKVWLDPVIAADLAQSVPQIGAPAAWAAGFDGTGTTVAVLDTGYDPAHPDIAGKVNASADFTGQGIVDGHGHGTHVASIAAGTGAASEGRYVGVAPGARLLVGKVLGNDGKGQGSWLIDGMEWAVDNGADVVNMSLSTEVTDGTDPLSLAVNELSAASGTLFVAAAGNTGPDERTSRSPANADAALSVAAVDKSDAIASFSSRGPRYGDYAMKPDIAAPGVDIVAARAAGSTLGTPVGERYMSLSGTSMATPHVAGAAAILKQAHPDWTGGQLKAALMNSSVEVAQTTAYDVGAGRVDLARAVAQQVTAGPGSVSFGKVPWSEEQRGTETRTITYHNGGTAAVTLGLTVEAATTAGEAAPAGMFSLDTTTLSVPAGGTADVRLTLDPNLGATALYDGQVLASAAGGTVLRTPFGVYKEPKMVQVVVDGISQDGSTSGGGSFVDLWNLDTDETVEGRFGGKGGAGPATLSVPVGTYSLMAFLWTLDAAGLYGREVTMVSQPEITLTEDAHIVLDGRDGQLLNPITPEPTESRELTLSYHRATAKHSYDMHYLMDRYVDAAYVTQTEPVSRGEFEVNAHWELYAPEFTMRLAGTHSRPDAEYTVGSPRIDGRKTFELADAGRGTPEDLAGRDLSGKLALIEQSDDVAIADQVEAVSAAGAGAAIVYYSRPGFLLAGVPDGSPIPSFTMEQAPGRDLVAKARAGGARLDITGVPESPYVYDLFPYYSGAVPASIDRRVSQRSLARVTANYYGSGSRQHGLEVNFPSRPHDSFVLREAQPVAIPSTRTEWVSPGEIVWQPVTFQTLDHQGALVGPDRTYRAGQRSVEDWFGPVVRPGVPAVGDADDARYGLPGFRTGDEFTIQIRSMLDSGDHHSEGGGNPRSRLYRDGQLVAERGSLEGTWPASAQPARYRLELDVQQSTPWWQHATSTHTAWDFSSSRPPAGEPAYLDLLQIDYDLATDLSGQVAANRPTEVGLRVYRQTHPDELVPVSLQVWVSYDDGGTWQAASKVKRARDGSFSASLKHPKGAESVSLRVKAIGPHGSSIDQTVIRAFSCP